MVLGARPHLLGLVVVLSTCMTLPASGSDQVLQLQTFLAERGCKPGALDGIAGGATSRALDAFNADTGLNVPADADAQLLAAIAPDKVCIDNFVPFDPVARAALVAASPSLNAKCSGLGWTPIPVLGDITMKDGQSGIVSSEALGDVAAAAGRAGDACLMGNVAACNAVLDALSEYARTDGLSYSGSRNQDSSQFQDTRLEFNHAILKLAGAYLVMKQTGYGAERRAAIDPWLKKVISFFDTPKSYFQDNHLTMAANVNALAYQLFGDDDFARRARRQWQASLADMRSDGSFPTEAQRGASALHYTAFEITLLMQLAELLLPAGVNLYETSEMAKLHRAVAFSLDAYENWDVISPYAQANRAPISPDWRTQDFRYVRLWSHGYFIYLQRFPHHPNAERIRTLMLDQRSCDQSRDGAPQACRGTDDRVSFSDLLQQEIGYSNGPSWINGSCAYAPLPPP